MQRKHIITKCCLRKVDANCQKNYTPPKNKFAKNGTHIHSWKRKIAIFDNNWLRTWIHVRHCLPACLPGKILLFTYDIFGSSKNTKKADKLAWRYRIYACYYRNQTVNFASYNFRWISFSQSRKASLYFSNVKSICMYYSIWENVLILIIHFIFRFDHEKIP